VGLAAVVERHACLCVDKLRPLACTRALWWDDETKNKKQEEQEHEEQEEERNYSNKSSRT
jgi:hypothetical protein